MVLSSAQIDTLIKVCSPLEPSNSIIHKPLHKKVAEAVEAISALACLHSLLLTVTLHLVSSLI